MNRVFSYSVHRFVQDNSFVLRYNIRIMRKEDEYERSCDAGRARLSADRLRHCVRVYPEKGLLAHPGSDGRILSDQLYLSWLSVRQGKKEEGSAVCTVFLSVRGDHQGIYIHSGMDRARFFWRLLSCADWQCSYSTVCIS